MDDMLEQTERYLKEKGILQCDSLSDKYKYPGADLGAKSAREK